MQLELSHLDLRYAGLRIIRPSKVSKLIQSINENGQRSAVLVLESASSKPILIDGYARVAALNALKRDLVTAQPVMETSQSALLSRLRQMSTSSSSAMEQGWILGELRANKLSQSELAIELGRSTSWISRRLALVQAMSDAVQDAVRSGKICPHGAMRYLVPLARANTEHCYTLVKCLGSTAISSRKIGMIYEAYRKADAIGKPRLLENPLLYLDVETKRGVLDDMSEQERRVWSNLERMSKLMGIVQGQIGLWGQDRWERNLRNSWRRVDDGFRTLKATIEEQFDAGPRHANGDLAIGKQGARAPVDIAKHETFTQSGEGSNPKWEGASACAEPASDANRTP